MLKTIRGLTNALLSMVGLRSSDAQRIARMVEYWEDNANHSAIPKEDAVRLANACLQYDRDPERRFVQMIACANSYGSIVGDAFHSYNPDTQRFTGAATPHNVAGESVELTHAGELLLLMTMRDDVENANFLERVPDSSSKHSDNRPVSSPTAPPASSLETAPFSIKLVKPVTIQTPIWYRHPSNGNHPPLSLIRPRQRALSLQ